MTIQLCARVFTSSIAIVCDAYGEVNEASWGEATLSIPTSEQPFRLEIAAIGGGSKGAVLVDDITILGDICTPLTPNVRSCLALTCNFEAGDLCSYHSTSAPSSVEFTVQNNALGGISKYSNCKV